jgi:NAD+ synthase
VRLKVDLPNYGVFDEKRVFVAGPMPGPIAFRGFRLGVPICEDIWGPDIVECLSETGAEILLVPNGSPFWRDKPDTRLQVAMARVVESGLPLVYLNQVGGQDEFLADGASFAIEANHTLAFQLPQFVEAIRLVTYRRGPDGTLTCADGVVEALPMIWRPIGAPVCWACATTWRRTVSPGVVLGLSGGIDSAVVAAMCVDALGPARVHCVMMPYRYTASISLEDAEACAKALGVRYDVVPIEPVVAGFEAALAPLFAGRQPRYHRREPAVARPRHDFDVDLQQVRPHGGHHGQQVGDVGWLCHALWRHEWRLQPD